MKYAIGLSLSAVLLLVGCGQQADSDSSSVEAAARGAVNGADHAETQHAQGSSESEAAVPSSNVKLTPSNTKIGFVGTHAGGDPNPRTGEFERFNGEIRLDQDRFPAEIIVEIESASLTTPIEKLSNHLRNEDFLDVRKYPKITFQSTSIEREDGENLTITGDLTLLETTKEISFPATASVSPAGLELTSDFTIDRTEFGMDKLVENVEKEVQITVAVDTREDAATSETAAKESQEAASSETEAANSDN